MLIIVAASIHAQPLKVMTYNIRYHNHGDGVNAWHNRKEKVADLIKKYNPDVFAVQEALHGQMQDLSKMLNEYTYVGVGRDDGKEKGEYAAIFYKKNKLKVIQSGSFWLSETPDIPGSMGWDAACTRMATWAKFEDVNTQQTFLVLTSHFDHIGKQARLQSIRQIRTWLTLHNDVNHPALLCGDFNFEPTEEPYPAFLNGQENWKDARPRGNTQGTFCGFEKGRMECVTIDYVFYTKEWNVGKYTVIQDNDGHYYPSDHLPVMVEVSLKP